MAGRPRKLNRKLEEQILELIADGLTIRQVFDKPEISYTWSSFRKELINSEELMMKYNQAKQLAIDLELSSLKDQCGAEEHKNMKLKSHLVKFMN